MTLCRRAGELLKEADHGHSLHECLKSVGKQPDPDTGSEYTTWCKYRDEFEDGSNCSGSCDQYASCESCGGFSAVRCGACDTIRYD